MKKTLGQNLLEFSNGFEGGRLVVPGGGGRRRAGLYERVESTLWFLMVVEVWDGYIEAEWFER